ncbi:MAG: DUF1080 domain-containing protein [Planctomycetes bacterium]|nr:DUF1080 domain-containing protein [Planctomycetota bacterium]
MLTLLLALCLPPQAPQDQPEAGAAPRDLSADFSLPEGLAVGLWAESPMCFNPTAMDVDARGRIWVTEAVNYRKWRGRNPGLAHPAGDRVVILEDTDGDGAADKSSVFVQDKDLVAPLGICVVNEKSALVSCSPNVFLYTDVDGDGKSDQRQTFLTGFGGPDHDHGVHSFVIGPDGQYYVAVGNAGPHLVKDKDGFTLRSGSLYNDGGEFVADNQPGLVSDDGRVWVGGLILRFDPRGGSQSVRAHNFRNIYEVALDSQGNLYTSDNDDDGSQGCRALWVLPRSDNGYFSADGSRYWNADRRPGQDVRTAHWHQDDPGVAPCGTFLGAGGPTGVLVVENAALGERFEGWMLAADAGASTVYGLAPRPQGSRVELDKSSFLVARERAEAGGKADWFRPSDVLLGTDGALYVSDWYDPGVGGHAMGDPQGHGRILRVTRRGENPRPPRIELGSDAGALAALASPAVNVRGRAARVLLAAADLPLLLQSRAKELQALDPATLARIAWVVAGRGVSLAPSDAAGAMVALRAGPNRPERLGLLARMAAAAGDPQSELTREYGNSSDPQAQAELSMLRDPGLLRELALALEADRSETALESWLFLASLCDGKDRTYLEALGIGARGREALLYTKLAAAAGDSAPWSEGMAALTWRLHTPASVPAVKTRAMAASLGLDLRRQAIDTLAFTQDRAAGEALLDVALAGPEDTREYACWWIRFRDTNDWSAWQLARQLGGGERASAKVLFESPLMHDGVLRAEVDLRGATRLYLAVDDGGNGNSCDWADWVDGALSGPGAELSLSDLPWSDARAGFGQVRKDLNCDGGPLVVAGKTHAKGLGTHADSEIAFTLPAGRFERLSISVGPDARGVEQNCGTSIRFRILAEVPPDPARFTAVEARLLDEQLPLGERQAAARELCATRDGGLFVLAGAERARYDEAARALLAEAIFHNPDLAVRALASERFQRPGAAGAAQSSLAALQALTGDARRGERVFFGESAQCARCHTFAGRGGDIGPDLTGLHAKYAPEAMFDAILNPSAGIAFGFDTWMFETDDDRVVSGFLLADGEKVIVKDTAGVRTVLDREEIVARRKVPVSAMPDNASAGLTPQELADVVAFLREDRAAPRTPGEPVALFNGVDLTGWTFFLNDPKAQASDVWSVADGVLDCKGNPVGYLRTEGVFEDFVLELDWRFPPGGEPGNSGVLLRRVGPDKVWPKSVEAQLQHRSAGDLWNIDEVPMVVDAKRTSGRRTAKQAPCNEVPQGQWNHYKITLDRGDLTLEVNGVVQNRASWVERVAGHICLQSEGSRIQFRNVVLRPLP